MPYKKAPAGGGGPVGVRSVWILSPVSDSLLFIGAPVVCILTLLPLRTVWSSERIAVLLLAFFTFGHHLPGFLRAYGDRELFARYRRRLLLAPPLIFTIALWFDVQHLHGLIILVFTWDIWHVLMQQYGFMRIYDSKQGAVNRWTSRLDLAVALSWYLALILASPSYRHNLLSRAYQTGIPLLVPEVVFAIQTTLWIAAALLTIVYVAYHLRLWLLGRPVSLRKLLLLGIFVGVTYCLYDAIDDFVVGFCIWSAFHCVQYYSIVWAFNRTRVARKSPVSRLLRFLFRPRVGLIVLYAGLILAYGSINYLTGFVSGETWRRLLLAFVFTSNALHYYYDGFMWKVREPQTRRDLNIASVPEAKSIAKLRPLGRSLANAAWLFGVLVVLAALETWAPHDELVMHQALAAAAPEVPEAHYNLGNILWRQGRLAEAADRYREALRRKPLAKAHSNLGAVLYETGHLEEAIAEYRQALVLSGPQPGSAPVSPNSPLIPSAPSRASQELFIVYCNLGDALSRAGRQQEALEEYRRALAINPRSAEAHAGRGATLALLGRDVEGAKELESALTLDPGYATAHLNLASLQASLGQNTQALAHYQMALQTGDERVRRAAIAAIEELSREK
jgi:tetratricopeptide (TPR) repeat protein